MCSRRKADVLISQGTILVNGKVPTDAKYIDTDSDVV
ncbi:MAG TPA: hypothetical protein ENJ35_01865, partial [Gammaproteobacteria bacterium]|nr:hypothetical protein [Gammaproteobacteria bacterium]